jgi:hypothetical protein
MLCLSSRLRGLGGAIALGLLGGCSSEPTLSESPSYNPNPVPDPSCPRVRKTAPESGDPASTTVVFTLTKQDPDAWVSASSVYSGPVEGTTRLSGKEVRFDMPGIHMDPGNTIVTLHYCGGETDSITLLGWLYL